MNAYIRMICTHVNQERALHEQWQEKEKPIDLLAKTLSTQRSERPTQRKQDKHRRRSRSPKERPKYEPEAYRARNEDIDVLFHGQSQPEQPSFLPRLSCRFITVEQYNQINEDYDKDVKKEELVKVLSEIGLDAATFRNLDYLFIAADNGIHSELVGVAPKQRFSFALDTAPNTFKDLPKSYNQWPMLGVIAIMRHLIPDIVLAKYNQIPVPDAKFWPIFGQSVPTNSPNSPDKANWAMRRLTPASRWSSRSATKDGSPNGPQQCDIHNCGAFLITNAFCLAFGYRLLCYAENWKHGNNDDLEHWKKHRVVFELIQGGFGGDFEYDLLGQFAWP